MTTKTIADSPVHDPTYLSGLTLSVSIQSTSSETGGWAFWNALRTYLSESPSISEPFRSGEPVRAGSQRLGSELCTYLQSLGLLGLSVPLFLPSHSLPLRNPELARGRL